MKREHKEEKKIDLMNCPLMQNNRDNTTNTYNIAIITKSGRDKIMIAKKRNWQQHKKRHLHPLGKTDRGSIDHSLWNKRIFINELFMINIFLLFSSTIFIQFFNKLNPQTYSIQLG
jgi:hypothetical protein